MENMAKEINFEGAKIVGNEDYTILDENNTRFVFGGRYTSDEYIQTEDENGKPKNMHKVTIDLICDNEQFISLMRQSGEKGKIIIQLV